MNLGVHLGWRTVGIRMFGRVLISSSIVGAAIRICLVCVALCTATEPGIETGAVPTAVAPHSSTQKYALLVGCTKYSGHATWQLQGPANDVQLLGKVLTEHFGFRDAQTVKLIDGLDDRHRPTKANIQREFERLAHEVHRDDQVVILLSGHGSQQPEQASADPDDHKLDGLDEIFLPADTGQWDETQQTVTNAILDDELRKWIDRITNTGAHAWVIIDACHSGTMLRGGNAETIRQISPAALQVPREAISRAKELAHQKSVAAPTSERNSSANKSFTQPQARLKNRVGLYAAQANEPTPELPLPEGAENAQSHGLLTYTLCQFLTPKTDGEQAVLTYRELAERIRQQYAAWDRIAPTPLAEGGDLDREVLGMNAWPGRSRIVLAKNREGRWQINAGSLLGLNRGSILTVYDPKTASDQPTACVEVKETGVATSGVTPCAYESVAKNDKLSPGSRCELVFVNFDSRPLKLGVIAESQDEHAPNQNTSAAQENLRKSLAPLENQAGSLVQLVQDPQQADWLLQLSGKQCVLIPRHGVVLHDGETAEIAISSQGFGPLDCAPERLLPVLENRLGRIAKAQALIHLAEQPAGDLSRGSDAVGIKIELIRYQDRTDKTGEVLHSGAGIELQSGQWIAFRLTNTSKQADIYPTLLYIDSKYEITPVFPREGELVESLAGGKSLVSTKLRVNLKTVGQEQLVAIAVKANGPPVDFSGLSQPTLQQARGDADQAKALKSPLGQLLQQAIFGSGTTRGLDCDKIEETALAHIVWKIRPTDTK